MSSLQPLYDVKERLEAAAIAGVGLLDEDFRLRRAAEALKPLAAASPVFGRISDGLEKLLAAPAKERAGSLLDVLSLVDAVAYTQGKSGMEGDLIPLPAGCGTYLPLSHGQLSPLLNALTGTGGRREVVVRLAWENHPEVFSDYRLLPLVIGGLADNYPEIPGLCGRILETMGPRVIPLLKRDFDPKGGYPMARRVTVIDNISGAEEESWFLAMLPEASKRVRAPLIYALRYNEENFERLRYCCLHEKGECLKRAVQAMTCLPGRQAAACTRELVRQHPKMVLEALGKSDNPLHGDLIAELLGKQFDKLFGKKPNWNNNIWNDTLEILPAAVGKDSPGMQALYREMAAWYAGHFDRWKANGQQYQNQRKILQLYPFLGREGKWPLPAGLLSASIWKDPSPALKELAEELTEKYGWAYYAPFVLAVGLTEGEEAVWTRFAPLLAPNARTQNQRLGILFGLGLLTGREKGKRTLDSRWTATLMSVPLVPIGGEIPLWRASGYRNQSWVHTEAPLELAICAADMDDRACTQAIRANLENLEPQPGASMDYVLEAMRHRGWRDWKGVLPALALATKERLSPLDLERWYKEYIADGMTNGEKIAELEWFRQAVRDRRLRTFVTWSEERIQQAIDNLKQ